MQCLWKVEEADLKLLQDSLYPKDNDNPFRLFAREISDTDTRDAVQLVGSGATRYATVLPLDDTHLASASNGEEPSIDWNSCRAWHDESVKVARRYDQDNWWNWECRHASYVTPPREKGDSAISDSYAESDYSLWTYLRQEERDKAITLTSDVVDRSFPGVLLEDVSSIILREE